MNILIKQIDNFMEKRIRFDSLAEARQYGIKGLPREEPKIPKVPKTSKQPKTTAPKRPRPKRTPIGITGEVARQLTPKGPYRTAEDVAEDIRESQRLARKISRIGKPKIDEGAEE